MEKFLEKYPKFKDFILAFVKIQEDFINTKVDKINEEAVLDKAKTLKNMKICSNVLLLAPNTKLKSWKQPR